MYKGYVVTLVVIDLIFGETLGYVSLKQLQGINERECIVVVKERATS